MVTTSRRCAVRARAESAARALSRRAVSGTAACCAAAHAGAAMQAQTNNGRSMISTSLEFGGASVSRPPVCVERTRQCSAASDERRAEWRREPERGLVMRADDLGGRLDHRCDVHIRRDDHDDRLSRTEADRPRAQTVVAALVPRRVRAVVIRARPLMRCHRHAAAVRHARHRVRRHHRRTRSDHRDGEHRGERTAKGGEDRSDHGKMIEGIRCLRQARRAKRGALSPKRGHRPRSRSS